MNKPASLRRQLLQWLLTLLIPLLLVGVAVAYVAATYIANLAYDNSLLRRTLALADQVEVENGRVVIDLPQVAKDLLEYDKDDMVYYRVTGPDGKLITGETDFALPARLPASGEHVYFNSELQDEPVRVVAFALPLKGTSAQGIALVQIAETLDKRDLMKEEIIAAMVLPQLLMVALATGLLFYGVKRGLQPLNRLRDVISQRSHLDLSAVPAEDSPQEVQPLLHAMNDLMQRVREAINLQQRFIADASHQLRTPLAGLKTQAEMALREQNPRAIHGALERMRDSSARLSHLVSQLLSIARVEPGSEREYDLQPLDLVQLAREITADEVSAALAKKIDLGFEAPATSIAINANALMIREMLTNLLDNAIRYTQVNGKVTVSVKTDGDTAQLFIEDNGSGIPPAKRERVFERFYRMADSPDEGCGLGLAIVREIALRHQASIKLTDAASGPGIRVIISFPLSGPIQAERL